MLIPGTLSFKTGQREKSYSDNNKKRDKVVQRGMTTEKGVKAVTDGGGFVNSAPAACLLLCKTWPYRRRLGTWRSGVDGEQTSPLLTAYIMFKTINPIFN